MKGNQSILLFIGVVVAANLLQCLCTGLLFDEAYYWVWSQHLAFGYFDHPPMIALFIAAGNAISHSETGVRIFTILANAGTIYILYRLIKPQNMKLFYVLLLSITPLLAAGFFCRARYSAFVFYGLLFCCLQKVFRG
jgi:4-amino-4-deoxy-L-arabinose transferase-like glycosyltransferase